MAQAVKMQYIITRYHSQVGRHLASGPSDYSHMVECNSDEDNPSIITNRQYEQRLQDKYRQIRLLDPQFLDTFVEEFDNLIAG